MLKDAITNITLTKGIRLRLNREVEVFLLIVLNKPNNAKQKGITTMFTGKSKLSNIEEKESIYTETFVSSIM